VYYHDWHRTKPPRVAHEGGILPAVSSQVYPNSTGLVDSNPRNTLMSSSGIVVAVNDDVPRTPAPNATQQPPPPNAGLPFDEEAKLVYGVVLSLRNMVKKLSGRYRNAPCAVE
jgi:trafficking protein particle complex subunit 1